MQQCHRGNTASAKVRHENRPKCSTISGGRKGVDPRMSPARTQTSARLDVMAWGGLLENWFSPNAPVTVVRTHVRLTLEIGAQNDMLFSQGTDEQ
ncbi:jg12581 [Pararge aegeria aegeria]|uniref:Jg12581 protein n=2 Tax=Pararge aegeria TaxID=116150 RepID=A0A8S4SEK3_9NEOP|nr:jg12581 [Pararge aegeria aegeria]